MVAAPRRLAAVREVRPRLLRTAILGGTLLSSALLTLHLTLPSDYALRETLRLPYDSSALSLASDDSLRLPGEPQLDAESADWSLSDLSGPDLRRTYRVFQPTAQPDYSAPEAGVVSADILSDACLEKWLGQGKPCDPEEVVGNAGELDVVWTWVNGSDPIWHAQFAHFADPSVTSMPEGWGVPPLRHYRVKEELKHSFRSVFEEMGVHGDIRTFHLVLGDWALGDVTTEVVDKYFGAQPGARSDHDRGREWRIGQMPAWLDAGLLNLERAGLTVKIHHHSQIFKDRTAADEEGALQYRDDALPTFNAFAIEAQLVNIPGLSPNFIYFNDDFFLTSKHSKADYYTPLLGPVLAFIMEAVIPFEEFPETACADEWSASLRSNWLLGRRFGDRKRSGLQHISKIFSRAVMEESAQIWAVDFARSTRRRFREVERGSSEESRIGDLHATWMASNLMVERSRESMLWVWAVARLGGLDGTWSTAAREEISAIFGVTTSARDGPVAAFDRTTRNTLATESLPASLRGMGLSVPLTTRYLWASYDGAAPADHRVLLGAETARLDVCFGIFWTEQADVAAVEMFKRIAFVYRTCGDQILAALISRSGQSGLSAILPPAGILLTVADPLPSALQPHMPLTTTWKATDFNLRTVVRSQQGEVDLRIWALRLIARYQYASGESMYQFTQMMTPEDIDKVRQIDNPGSTVSGLALNDDIEGSEEEQDRSVLAIKTFLRQRWPRPGWWERPS